MTENLRDSLPVWVFSFAFFPLGLGGVVLGGADILLGYQSRQWQPVQGTVLSSVLEPSVLAPDQPSIRYSYKFDGRSYVSTRIWPGHTLSHMPTLTFRASQGWVNQFGEGNAVTVYVNAKSPGDVVLVPGPRKAYVWMGIFTFFLTLGFWSPLAVGRLFEKRQARP